MRGLKAIIVLMLRIFALYKVKMSVKMLVGTAPNNAHIHYGSCRAGADLWLPPFFRSFYFAK